MGLRVNTNVPSIQATNSLNKVSKAAQESFSKLSSGEKINKAADDAAGMAISEKMKSVIRSSKQANRNANDGISMVQTAEGGLSESSSILTRMRELAMQASTDTISDSDRAKSSLEYEALKDELERISQSIEYNGMKLLDGKTSQIDFQVGTGSIDKNDYISFRPSELNSGVQSLGVSSLSIRSKLSAQSSLTQMDQAINRITNQRATLGSIQNRLVNSTSNLMSYTENMSSANNRIRDTDFAEETSQLTKNAILMESGTAVLAQANTTGKGALKLL